jgi:hypothetical protein
MINVSLERVNLRLGQQSSRLDLAATEGRLKDEIQGLSDEPERCRDGQRSALQAALPQPDMLNSGTGNAWHLPSFLEK